MFHPNWGSGTQSLATTQAMTQRLYKQLPDAFDFLMLTNNDSVTTFGTTYAGLYNSVKNEIVGTGDVLTNKTAAFGSSGTLQGVIHLTSLSGVKGGPSLHELMHR